MKLYPNTKKNVVDPLVPMDHWTLKFFLSHQAEPARKNEKKKNVQDLALSIAKDNALRGHYRFHFAPMDRPASQQWKMGDGSTSHRYHSHMVRR